MAKKDEVESMIFCVFFFENVRYKFDEDLIQSRMVLFSSLAPPDGELFRSYSQI